MANDESDSGPLGRVSGFLRSRYMFKIGLVILLVTVVLLGVGFFAFTQAQGSVESDAEERLASSAEREANGIDDFVGERSNDTRRLSREGAVGSGNETEIRELLDQNIEILPDSVRAIHYYEIQGQTIRASTNRDLEDETLSRDEIPWAIDSAQGVFENEGEVLTFEPYEDGGETVLGFVSTTRAQSFAIVVTVNLQDSSQLLESPVEGGVVEIVSEEDGKIFLTQNTNRILSDSFVRSSSIDGVDIPDQDGDRLSETTVDTASVESDAIDSDRAVVAVAPVEEQPWAVVVAAPETTVFETADQVRNWVGLLIVCALVGFLLVGVVISRDLNKALDKITKSAEEIEDGNLDVEIDTARPDEFGKLSGLVDRIRATLKDQIQEAEAAREDAETARKKAETAQKEAEQMSEYLKERAQKHSDIMQKVGDGDLRQRMEADGREASMDKIAEQFNQMMDELEKTVGQLDDYVDEVERAGEEVETSAGTVQTASQQIAESIQTISDDAYEQQQWLEEAASTTDEIAEEFRLLADDTEIEMNGIVERVEEIADDLNEIAELNDETLGATERIAGASEEQAAELSQVSERANALQRYARPLRDILQRFETEQQHEFVFSVGPTDERSSETSSED